MKFFRKNVFLLLILGGFLLLLSGCIYLLLSQISKNDQLLIELEDKKAQRETLWANNIYLSKVNIERVRENAKVQEELTAKIREQIKGSSISVQPMEGTAFASLKLKTINELTTFLNKNIVSVPARFQFGFDEYLNKVPDSDQTPFLQKELEIIRELVNLCVDAGIQKLNGVRRVSAGQKPSEPADHNPEKEPLISMGDEFNTFQSDGNIYFYSVIPFDLSVTGSPAAFKGFLNKLALSKYVLVPRLVLVENEKKEKTLAQKEKESPGSQDEGQDPEVTSKSRKGKKSEKVSTVVDPIAAPLVIGGEVITVQMRIDWLEIHSEKGDQTAKKSDGKSAGVGKGGNP